MKVVIKGISLCIVVFFLIFVSGCAHSPRSLDQKSSSIDTRKADSSGTIENRLYKSNIQLENGDVLTTRALMDEARSLACTGAMQYVNGEMESAKANLEAAILDLQLADLPEDMQNINFFQPYLPDECRQVNLEKAYKTILEAATREEYLQVEGLPAGQFAASDEAFIEVQIHRLMEILGEEPTKPEDLEIFVEEVEKFISYFQNYRRDWFERSYYRMMKYWDTVETIMSEKRLPPELAYLAFIESGFLYRATSRAEARGIWQFIRGTAKDYGLEVGRRIDDRLDPIKSTIAAREYLLDLIAIFGSKSFLLAMASYNAGEGKVQRCLRSLDDPFENRSFWQIRDCLRQETQEYVPRIIAAAILCENPKRFGFDFKTRDELSEEMDLVICSNPVRLTGIAQAAGITLDELRRLNPDLPSGGYWTPVNNTHLWVPKNRGVTVQTALATMPSSDPEPAPPVENDGGDQPDVASKNNTEQQIHIVGKGETLYTIGRKFNVAFKTLAQWNNIPRPYNIKPGQKIVVKTPCNPVASNKIQDDVPVEPSKSITYTVQKGNCLTGIGSLFGVSVSDIIQRNKLSKGHIYPGQQLSVRPSFAVEMIEHKVGPGETLNQISQKYKVKIDEILFTNGLEYASVKSGINLTIYKKAAS